MDKKEYAFFNRVLVTIFIITGMLLLYLDDSGHIHCVQLSITGQECKSCGLTRDFTSYLNLDFNSAINPQSLPLFIFCAIQLLYRLYVGFVQSGYGSLSRMSKSPLQEMESHTKSRKIERNLKTVITLDAVITVFATLFIALPFWM